MNSQSRRHLRQIIERIGAFVAFWLKEYFQYLDHLTKEGVNHHGYTQFH